MRLLNCSGYIFRLSDAKAREYFRAVADGKEPSLEDFGKDLGYAIPVLDLEPEGARDLLDEMKRSRK